MTISFNYDIQMFSNVEFNFWWNKIGIIFFHFINIDSYLFFMNKVQTIKLKKTRFLNVFFRKWIISSHWIHIWFCYSRKYIPNIDICVYSNHCMQMSNLWKRYTNIRYFISFLIVLLQFYAYLNLDQQTFCVNLFVRCICCGLKEHNVCPNK